MRKLWLTFTAMLFCSIASFAQTEIWTKADFEGMSSSGNYILMADINLGDYGERSSAIIESFSGTFNGNGKTITYQASFQGTSGTTNYSLFGSVSGTIKNLNVNATVTLAGTVSNMNVALICGSLTSSGTIEYCKASGNVNSTVNPSNGGGSDAGLIVGESAGKVRYCTGTGNVVGVGYAGGLIGQMTNSASVLACSFTGSVTAQNPSSTGLSNLGSFAGGICGFASNNSSLEFCAVDANINGIKATSGIASAKVSSWLSGAGSPDVENSYASGNVNGESIDDESMTNSSGTTTPNYFEGEMEPDEIVEALNNAIPNDQKDKFYFDVINGEVVLIIGQRPTTPDFVCESPIGLTVSIENGIFTANWSVENQDASYNEQEFIISISGGEFGDNVVEELIEGTSITVEDALQASVNPYVFTVKSQCNTVYSNALTYTFYVNENCATINALQADSVTSTSAKVTWQGEADEIKLNGVAVEFTNGQTLELEDLTPGLTYIIEAIVYCTHDGGTETLTTSVTFTTHGDKYETKQSGIFNDPNTWLDNAVPQGEVATITINKGHIVTVNHNLIITNDYKIAVNKGALYIKQQGQLINTTEANVPGIIEIEAQQPCQQGKWAFIGAPFEDEYALGTIIPEDRDVSVSRYDYSTANWSDDWAHTGTLMDAGEGYFAWPFYSGSIIYTTYGDLYDYSTGSRLNYDFERGCHTAVNNTDVTITATTADFNGGWMALSNPYPAKLSVSEFVAENNIVSTNQGKGIYRLTNNISNGVQTYVFVPNGDIAMTEGFFVNLASGNSVTFSKEQLTNYPTTQAKSQVAPREFINLALVDEGVEVDLLFAYNEESDLAYDIFDANKMFSPVEISEPYFVTDGISLVKEEVNELPYYATMNVRSYKDTVMNFVMKNIPEGLAVSIIDGEQVIDMVEGSVYSTNVATGENADRFKLLVKKNLGIADVEELEVNITNNNRHISIATTETDLQVEVYNALGQKVLSTKDRNFTLNQVSAGAYLIKAFNNKASKTQKIVVE